MKKRNKNIEKETKEAKETKETKESVSEQKKRISDGIKKTIVPGIIGAIFSVILFLKLGTASDILWYNVLIPVLIAAYLLQSLIYPFIGIKELEKKDWLYVEFMFLIFLYIFWTFLINK